MSTVLTEFAFVAFWVTVAFVGKRPTDAQAFAILALVLLNWGGFVAATTYHALARGSSRWLGLAALALGPIALVIVTRMKDHFPDEKPATLGRFTIAVETPPLSRAIWGFQVSSFLRLLTVGVVIVAIMLFIAWLTK